MLGLWVADPRKIPPGSTHEPLAALNYYQPFLAAGPSVVAGDFNRLPQQMSVRHGGAGSSVLDTLAQAGLVNADTIMGDAAGQVSLRRTHFHQRKFSRGFVTDYIFIPTHAATRSSAFAACDPHDWITWSDHVRARIRLNAAYSIFAKKANSSTAQMLHFLKIHADIYWSMPDLFDELQKYANGDC